MLSPVFVLAVEETNDQAEHDAILPVFAARLDAGVRSIAGSVRDGNGNGGVGPPRFGGSGWVATASSTARLSSSDRVSSRLFRRTFAADMLRPARASAASPATPTGAAPGRGRVASFAVEWLLQDVVSVVARCKYFMSGEFGSVEYSRIVPAGMSSAIVYLLSCFQVQLLRDKLQV